jgi:hypothetical protein
MGKNEQLGKALIKKDKKSVDKWFFSVYWLYLNKLMKEKVMKLLDAIGVILLAVLLAAMFVYGGI